MSSCLPSFSSRSPLQQTTENPSTTWHDVSELDALNSGKDHHEIRGLDNEMVASFNQEQQPSSYRWMRAITRTKADKEDYRRGIERVRTLFQNEFDKNAAERFDKHFAYRYYMGKPLTVRALKEFHEKEKKLRNATFNITTQGRAGDVFDNPEHKNLQQRPVDKLIDLKNSLESATTLGQTTVIGASAEAATASIVADQPKKYWFPVIPVALSWFETAADTEDERKGKAEGIAEARKAIVEELAHEGISRHTNKYVEHLFDITFASKSKNEEALTVEELKSFVDEAIKTRDHASTLLGILQGVVLDTNDSIEDVTEKIKNAINTAGEDVKQAWTYLGRIAAAGVELNTIATAGDPITLAVKGILTGGVLAAESTDERILTAVMMHFVSSSASSGWSMTSWFTNAAAKEATGGIL